MSIFRYYITNVLEGLVEGTDDEVIARDFSRSEDFFVIDSKTGKWFGPDDETFHINEIETGD